jgi:hypothetical protein
MLQLLVLGWVRLNIMRKQNNKNGKRISKKESLEVPFCRFVFLIF